MASLLLYPRTYSQEVRKAWFDKDDDYFVKICTDKITSKNLMEKIMMENGEDIDYFKLKTVKRICVYILYNKIINLIEENITSCFKCVWKFCD